MKKLGLILTITLVLAAGAYFGLRDSLMQNVAAKKESKQEKPNRLIEADIDKNNILFSSNAEASLRVLHQTINEYYVDDRVEAIVEGTISNIEYTHIDSSIFTILTVDVSRTLKGSTEKTIVVYEDGGFAKFKDMLEVFEGHIDMSKITPTQMENGLVEDKMFGAPHSKTGQQVVLFLVKNPNLGSDPTRTYQIVSSAYGKLTLDKQTGIYKRFELDVKDDPADKSAVLEKNAVPFETSVPKADLVSRLTNE